MQVHLHPIHRLALGAETRERTMIVRGPLSRIIQDGEEGAGQTLESVPVVRLDDFCLQNGMRRVGLLKIDTEGHDLEVLRGAEALLGNSTIDVVQVEAGMTRRNDLHVPFRAFEDFFGERDYLLFGFYDQKHEWSGEPQLRRADAVFVSSRVVNTMRWR